MGNRFLVLRNRPCREDTMQPQSSPTGLPGSNTRSHLSTSTRDQWQSWGARMPLLSPGQFTRRDSLASSCGCSTHLLPHSLLESVAGTSVVFLLLLLALSAQGGGKDFHAWKG